MSYLQVPHRLFPNEHPSVARLVQFILCDDGWARIDAHRMAYEHIYGIKLSEREAETHIRQRAAMQQRLTSYSGRRTSVHNPDIPSSSPDFDRLVDKGGIDYPLSDRFASLSLDNGDMAQHDTSVGTSPQVPIERPRMVRASTSTSGVSVVVPSERVQTPITTERKDSLATFSSSSIGPHSSSSLQDREYKHWGRLDDPDSVWNNLHVERPKLNERRKFSSYREYKKTRNQPMKDNDRLFKKRVKQSFAKEETEVLGVGLSDDVDEGEGEDSEETETRGTAKTVHKRQILLVKRKGNLAGQNL